MALSWSHAVIYVEDPSRMLDFYTRVLGFEITDRGMTRGGTMEIIFLSQSPREHHQLAFIPIAAPGASETGADSGTDPGRERAPSRLAHFAFRLESLAELRTAIAALEREAVTLRPLSHGNTWSVYLDDPEGNGVELFCETPWHVQQPAGEVWDTASGDEELREWTRRTFESATGFSALEDYYARRAQELEKV